MTIISEIKIEYTNEKLATCIKNEYRKTCDFNRKN